MKAQQATADSPAFGPANYLKDWCEGDTNTEGRPTRQTTNATSLLT